MKKHFFSIVLVLSIFALATTSCKKSDNSASDGNASEKNSTTGSGEIMYVDIDTIFSKFDMYKDVQAELQTKLKASEDQMAAKENAYRKGVSDYQYKAQRGLVTRTEAETIEQNLGVQQQELMQLQNNLQTQLQEESMVAQRKVLNFIIEYLKEVEKENGYKYVLGATFGGNILYADENLNITTKVTEGLNAKYKADKEAGK